MTECIRLDIDCAEICRVASAFMARRSDLAADVQRLGRVCDACGE
jgi:hypothetical protein